MNAFRSITPYNSEGYQVANSRWLTRLAGGHALDYERSLRRLSKVSTFDRKLVHFVTVKAPEPKLGGLNSR